MRRAGGLAFLVSSAVVTAAQTPTFSTGVEAVRVDVLVTDGDRPVLGLGPADFEVRDNGVRQDVSFVSTETLTAVSSAVVAESLTATGPSFVGVTVTLTVAEAVPPLPSPTV